MAERSKRVRRMAFGAAVLAVLALAVGVAVRASDGPGPGPDPGLQTQLVRGDGDQWCVEATLAAAERVLSRCTAPGAPMRTGASLSTDCPTKRVVVFGAVRPSAREVVVEATGGDHEAQLTEAAAGAPVRGFAAALHLDDFPARLRVTGGGPAVVVLPDPVGFCRDNPDLTTTLTSEK